MAELIRGAWRSRTIKFNGFVLAMLTALSQTDLIVNNPDWSVLVAAAITIANMVLRAKTDKPLADR